MAYSLNVIARPGRSFQYTPENPLPGPNGSAALVLDIRQLRNCIEQLYQAPINVLAVTWHSYGFAETNPELENGGYGEAVLNQRIES